MIIRPKVERMITPFFKAKRTAPPGQVVFVDEAFARSFVLSQLQRRDEARALDLADQRVLAEHFAQASVAGTGRYRSFTWRTMPSSRNALRLASATAAATGCPE